MRETMGLIGALVIAASAGYYLLDVLHGNTRPQRASWLVWAVVGVLGFATSDAAGAGPGAYAAGIDTVACVATFLISTSPRYGKPGGRRVDWLLAAAALAGVALWQWGALTTAAAAAAAVVCDAVALYPTLREAWRQPRLESLPSWGADVAGNACCVLAVSRPSLAALAFPGYLALAAAAVSGVLLLQRFKVGRAAHLSDACERTNVIGLGRPNERSEGRV